jgi:hypothetical protein
MNFEGILLAMLFFALVGFIAYLIITYVPMPEVMKQVFGVIVAILCIVYLIALLFGHATLPSFPGLH